MLIHGCCRASLCSASRTAKLLGVFLLCCGQKVVGCQPALTHCGALLLAPCKIIVPVDRAQLELSVWVPYLSALAAATCMHVLHWAG